MVSPWGVSWTPPISPYINQADCSTHLDIISPYIGLCCDKMLDGVPPKPRSVPNFLDNTIIFLKLTGAYISVMNICEIPPRTFCHRFLRMLPIFGRPPECISLPSSFFSHSVHAFGLGLLSPQLPAIFWSARVWTKVVSSASVHVAVFLSVSSAIGAGCGGMEA